MSSRQYDAVVLGAGIYGMYAAWLLSKKYTHVLVLEKDPAAFSRASFVNQARLHNGYHYPRSITTAESTARYYQRFSSEFSFAINDKFKQIYAISAKGSKVTPEQYEIFCKTVHIPLKGIPTKEIFIPGSVLAAYQTEESSFDYEVVRQNLLKRTIDAGVTIEYSTEVKNIDSDGKCYSLTVQTGDVILAPYVVNATYASVNQVNTLFGLPTYAIKYELCEVCVCDVPKTFRKKGITVVDGLFFSIMPFGNQGFHSLTSVAHSPRLASYENLPKFICQQLNPLCTPSQLENCNSCPAKPKTAWGEMKYLVEQYIEGISSINYRGSYFAVKAILLESEIDDSRPTVIKTISEKPRFVSVLSGKINTLYDLDDVI